MTRFDQPLGDYMLQPPDEPEWCEDCYKNLDDCFHGEQDPDAAYEAARDRELERYDD